MNNSIKSEIHRLSKIPKLLGICDVTGIEVELNIPYSTSFLLYKNPLADINNVIRLIETDKDNLVNLPSQILAGMLLAVLKKKKLLESKLTAIEQNCLLKLAAKNSIIELLSLVLSLTKEDLLFIAKLSIDSQLLVNENEKGTSINSLIRSYTKTIKNSLDSELFLDSSRTSVLTTISLTSTKVEKTILTIEVKATLRKSLAVVKDLGIVNPKIISIIELSLTGNNLVNLLAEDGLGNKILPILKNYQTPETDSLLSNLVFIKKNFSTRDKANQLFASDLDRISDLSSSSPVKKSLAEILAAKQNRSSTEEVEEASIEEIEEFEREEEKEEEEENEL